MALVPSTNTALLLTAPGVGAIAVVRLLGPRVSGFITRHFSRPTAEGKCIHGQWRDAETDSAGPILDDPVITRLASGGADVNLHGSPWIVRAFLDQAQAHGFNIEDHTSQGQEPATNPAHLANPRPPAPDPFALTPETHDSAPDHPSTRLPTHQLQPLPLAAVEGLTLLEREAMSHLPLAPTELAAQTLLAQPQAWADFLSQSLARAAENHHLALQSAHNQHLKDDIRKILADPSLIHLLHPPRVAIIGAPNVGKSTLANQLFARQRVITADLPGTTRDWVGEIANLDGLAIMLVDTPGIRSTIDPIESAAISRSSAQIEAADLVLIVLDPTQPLEAQSVLLNAWSSALRIVNKSDLPPAWDPTRIAGLRTIGTTGQGIDDLRRQIRRHFNINENDSADHPRWWTMRQRTILEEAAIHPEVLSRFIDNSPTSSPPPSSSSRP